MHRYFLKNRILADFPETRFLILIKLRNVVEWPQRLRLLRNARGTGPGEQGSVRGEVPIGVRASWWAWDGLDVGSKPGQ